MEDNKEIMEAAISEEEEKVEETSSSEIEVTADVEVIAMEAESKGKSRKNRENKGRNRRRNEDRDAEAAQSEWQERVIQIRRVTKVVKGGKKLSFRAIVIVGNQKGQVGVGCAKASEVIIAIQKAVADGRKNLISVPIFKTTIPHPIQGRSGAGSVMLRPASEGTGVIAGGAVRAVLELAGIENILSKSLGSKSPLNAANATMNALKSLRLFSDAAKTRGLSVMEMLS